MSSAIFFISLLATMVTVMIAVIVINIFLLKERLTAVMIFFLSTFIFASLFSAMIMVREYYIDCQLSKYAEDDGYHKHDVHPFICDRIEKRYETWREATDKLTPGGASHIGDLLIILLSPLLAIISHVVVYMSWLLIASRDQ